MAWVLLCFLGLALDWVGLLAIFLISVSLLRAEAGVCARRRSNFLSLRRKKVTKERATLLAVSLRFAAGNLRCSFAGCAA
jgi:hypothetical protein